MRTLGAEGLFLFSSLDINHDLYLSPEEFKPIAEKLTGKETLCPNDLIPALIHDQQSSGHSQ